MLTNICMTCIVLLMRLICYLSFFSEQYNCAYPTFKLANSQQTSRTHLFANPIRRSQSLDDQT